MEKDIKALEEVCKLIVDHLKDNYDPHCALVITDSQIKLVRDEIGIAIKEAAPEVLVQEQLDKYFVISLFVLNNIYYLVDLEFSISRNIRDSMIIISKENAYKLASETEKKYKNALGKVVEIKLKQFL